MKGRFGKTAKKSKNITTISPGQEIRLVDSWKVICIKQLRLCISNSWTDSKMFHITSKHCSIFSNTSPANWVTYRTNTAQKRKFPIKDIFSKCIQILSFLRIWSHLLKKSLMKSFIFCVVKGFSYMLFLIVFSFITHSIMEQLHKFWGPIMEYFLCLSVIFIDCHVSNLCCLFHLQRYTF